MNRPHHCHECGQKLVTHEQRRVAALRKAIDRLERLLASQSFQIPAANPRHTPRLADRRAQLQQRMDDLRAEHLLLSITLQPDED